MHCNDFHVRRFILVLVVLLCFSAVWRWSPLGRLIDVDTLGRWIDFCRESPLAPLAVVLSFVVGGMLMFPVFLLVVATVLTYDPVTAFVYCLLGCMASAMALFVMGQWLGGDSVRRIAGKHYAKLSHQLDRRGWVVVLTMRLFPIAPYTVVNLVAGASPLRFGDYLLGTFLGEVPWLILLCALGERIEVAIAHPSPSSYLIAAAVFVLVILANIATHKWMACESGSPQAPDTPETKEG